MDEDTNNKYVKLHMDIMTHHSRVNTKVEESLRSIKAKVGFVPREVEEHLKELQNIQVLFINVTELIYMHIIDVAKMHTHVHPCAHDLYLCRSHLVWTWFLA